jgi:TolA-binding protein
LKSTINERIHHINSTSKQTESRWINGNLSKFISIIMVLGIYLTSLSGCLETTDLSSTLQGKIVLAQNYMDQKKIDSAITLYKKVAADYPDTTEAATALYKAGEAYDDYLNDWETALYTYEHMASVYPDSEYTDDALFRLAVIYDEKKNDPSKAKQLYQKILDSYSSGDMAEATRNKMINLQNRGY